MSRDPYYDLFPESKIALRTTLFRDAIRDAVETTARTIRDHTGLPLKDCVSSLIGVKRLEKIVVGYIETVIDFKINHGMAPTDRIKPSKIAAIAIHQIRLLPDAHLARFHPQLPASHPYVRVLRAMIYDRILSVALGLDGDFVATDIGDDLVTLFMNYTSQTEPSVVYLCMLFEVLAKLYGDPTCCLEDD